MHWNAFRPAIVLVRSTAIGLGRSIVFLVVGSCAGCLVRLNSKPESDFKVDSLGHYVKRFLEAFPAQVGWVRRCLGIGSRRGVLARPMTIYLASFN